MPEHLSPPDDAPAMLARGANIGRYFVLGLLGRGGMGEVYAAYDPELDRKVALKVLRVKAGNGVSLSEGRQRTLREAQAIAQLSHPNVVVVYDVGTFDGQVFIAMEFLDGNTVTYWLSSQPRTWREILKVFIAAGRGLQAAHDKGLVHRDFKPDNVMVGKDGQVRVMDFGLARQVGDKGGEKLAENGDQKPADKLATTDWAQLLGRLSSQVMRRAPLPVDTHTLPLDGNDDTGGVVQSGLFDARLTRTGAMMGTPAYMAPEQFFGTRADARTDQFSFCVALYEALYGERPFAGNSMLALTANVVQGSVREAPVGAKVPPWIRKILLRGLRPAGAERYPAMADILDALGKSRPSTRRKVALVGTLILLPIAIGAGVRQRLIDRRAVCGGGAAKLAEVWDLTAPGQPEGPRQARIHAAFLQTGRSYAADVFATTSRALTDYAQRWASMYRGTCEATQLRHEQSGEVLDLRMSCLQERLVELGALTNVFASATGEVVQNAVNASSALASLDRCADVPLLRALVRPPEDPATRLRVADLRRRLANLKALLDAGRWNEAIKGSPALVSDTRATGYQPLIAESLNFMGGIYIRQDDFRNAEKVMVESFWTADASRHDELRAEAAGALVYVVGYQQARFDDAYRWAKIAEAILDRLGGRDLLHAWLLNDLGCVLELQGRYAEAVQTQERALALKEKVLAPDHPDIATSETNLAISLQGLGHNEEALTHDDRAIALLSAALGEGHPDLAMPFNERGEILNALRRYPQARESFDRARGLWERDLGLESLPLSHALTGIGIGYLEEGKPTSAIAPLERAYKIRAAREPEHARRGETSFALARALWDADRDRGRARNLAEEAMSEYAKSSARTKELEVKAWLHDHAAS
jgi:eukaryotic-like serine/threonine-protein kinase